VGKRDESGEMLTPAWSIYTAENDYAALREVLDGKREPNIMKHFTRIIGYFSRVSNWNPSKVAELADRQKGDYSIGGEHD